MNEGDTTSQSRQGPPGTSILSIFRFGDKRSIGLLAVAVAGAVCNGTLTPLFSILFGNLINSVGKNSDDLMMEVNRCVLLLLSLSCAALLAGYIETSMASFSGFTQTQRARSILLSSVLHQDMAWHDLNKSSAIMSQGLGEDAVTLQSAISDSFCAFIRNMVTCITGLIIAFARGWDMALVILATMPALVITGSLLSRFSGSIKVRLSECERECVHVANEAISKLKTIYSYGLEEHFSVLYSSTLSCPEKIGTKLGLFSGLSLGSTAGIFSFSYALALWYGSLKVSNGIYNGGQVISILFSGVMAGFSLSEAVPHMRRLQDAVIASHNLWSPTQQKDVEKQIKLDKILGDIEFENVSFHYPSRPERLIFKNLSFVAPANSCIAVVGPSGSGKSSIIQLLMRYYEPCSGKILVDGQELSMIDKDNWRRQVALVPQEPAFFNASVMDNILMARPTATKNELILAAKAANAHEFISKLPKGYSTVLGVDGGMLSGGQRQRIAIARAFLRNPKVLLLDEATSALDNRSENLIQESMESLFVGRTTIMVAHKLSTVAVADMIAVVSNGVLIEQGSHEDLLRDENSFYRSLVKRQAEAYKDDDEMTETKNNLLVAKKIEVRAALRDSVLRRRTVRLSVIPQSIRKRLTNLQDNDVSEIDPTNRLLWMSRHNWFYGIVGSIASLALSLQMPAFALALAGIIEVFYRTDEQSIREGGRVWACAYIGIGFGCISFGALQGWAFEAMGMKLVTTIRRQLFGSMLRQDISFFESSKGKSPHDLLNQCTDFRQAISSRIGSMLQNTGTLIAAFVIAFSSSWELALVVLSVLPLLLAAQYIQGSMTNARTTQDDNTLNLNRSAIEAVRQVKLVQAYNLTDNIVNRFNLGQRSKSVTKFIHLAGISFGCSQFVLFNTIGLAFWFGARRLDAGAIDILQLMRAFCALYFATFSIAQTSLQFAEIGSIPTVARGVFDLIDRKSAIDKEKGGAKLPICSGDIEFKDVTFCYPARPNRLVFKNFSLRIAKGSSCALVGESGHGKSTVISLLQRFYDPVDGQILLDGINIQNLDLSWLRGMSALVSQEPVLFDGTILQNIKVGNPFSSYEEVVEASMAANALEFIENLPEKFETVIGTQKMQLSGGQKQRIAIARAILRNPKVLLLDEATSALDAKSENFIQSALEALMVGRTTISVAHRLATVKKMDKIAAVYRGRVLEEGTHDELMELDQYYAYLVKCQS